MNPGQSSASVCLVCLSHQTEPTILQSQETSSKHHCWPVAPLTSPGFQCSPVEATTRDYIWQEQFLSTAHLPDEHLHLLDCVELSIPKNIYIYISILFIDLLSTTILTTCNPPATLDVCTFTRSWFCGTSWVLLPSAGCISILQTNACIRNRTLAGYWNSWISSNTYQPTKYEGIIPLHWLSVNYRLKLRPDIDWRILIYQNIHPFTLLFRFWSIKK